MTVYRYMFLAVFSVVLWRMANIWLKASRVRRRLRVLKPVDPASGKPFITVANPRNRVRSPFSCGEIEGIFGGLGSGKSYMALVRYIWPELTRGTRVIVTNHKLNLGRLREVLQSHADLDGSQVERVRILSDDEMKNFWIHRGRSADGTWWDAQDVQVLGKGQRGESAIRDYNMEHPHARPLGGVLYVFDEAHFGFRARDFATFAREAEWYFNHVRKMGDSVILCTPHPDQLDKYIRNLLQNVVMMRNGAKEKFMTIFRAPKRIFWQVYLGPYDTAMPKQASGFFEIEPWLADCYDTAAGAGIVGASAADTKNQPVGLPFWTLPALGLLIIGLFVGLPFVLNHAVAHGLSPAAAGPVASVPLPVVVLPKVETVAPEFVRESSPVRNASPAIPLRHEHKNFFNAWCSGESNRTIVSWDGEILTATSWSADGRHVVVDGDDWYFKTMPHTNRIDPGDVQGGGNVMISEEPVLAVEPTNTVRVVRGRSLASMARGIRKGGEK